MRTLESSTPKSEHVLLAIVQIVSHFPFVGDLTTLQETIQSNYQAKKIAFSLQKSQ